MRPHNRFTVYDAMEARGVFDKNPANIQSRDQDGTPLYVGPVEFPKMMYHPQGAVKVIVPAEVLMTPLGAKLVGEQVELIYRTVKTPEEEAALVAEGWHHHPAKAIGASGKPEPAIGAGETIRDLQREKDKLLVEIEALRAERDQGGAPAAASAGLVAVSLAPPSNGTKLKPV